LFRNLESLNIKGSGIKQDLVDYVGYVNKIELDEGEE